MFNVDLETKEIRMHRGDTGSFKVEAARKSGAEWSAEDRMLFTVKNDSGDVVMQRIYRLDDAFGLGNGVVLMEFHNDDTDSWANGQYKTEWRYIIGPYWSGEAPTGRCVDALRENVRMVEGDVVRVPAGGQSTLTIDDIYGEV